MSNGKKIRVLYVKTGEKPVVVEIENKLEAMQKLVGGYIEAVPLEREIDAYCNEEGKLIGLPLNRRIPGRGDVFAGDFFVSRANGDGEQIDLTDEDVTHYSAVFA